MTATIIVDRAVLEQFIVEVDALATLDMLRSGADSETKLSIHVYNLLGRFEDATLGRLGDEESGLLHDRGVARGRELARGWFGESFDA